uniref:Condensation domain-containing protein n=1 Tax=Plectus sambesii TaxID=2011161 RepID=A0A914VQI8_9BILA
MGVQYADYAMWQRSVMVGETVKRHVDYWKAKLGDYEGMQLPTDKPRPIVQTHNGDVVVFKMGKRLHEQIEQLTKATNSTEY